MIFAYLRKMLFVFQLLYITKKDFSYQANTIFNGFLSGPKKFYEKISLAQIS